MCFSFLGKRREQGHHVVGLHRNKMWSTLTKVVDCNPTTHGLVLIFLCFFLGGSAVSDEGGGGGGGCAGCPFDGGGGGGGGCSGCWEAGGAPLAALCEDASASTPTGAGCVQLVSPVVFEIQ
jgi:hypothetical protein